MRHVLATLRSAVRSEFATLAPILAVGLVVSVFGSAAVTAQELPPWGIVASPNQGNHDNTLKAIHGLQADDLWAVGEYNPGIPPTESGRRTLIEHWDGSAWSIVTSPNPTWPGLDYATLEDVVALSPTEAWAVGYSQDFASLRLNTLIMRWDGAQWEMVRTPNPAGTNQPNQLLGIAAEPAGGLWAVGMKGLFPDESPIILHRTSPGWAVVANDCTSPQTLGYRGLNAVLAIGPNDVWAAGDAALCHYDGQSWTVVPSPQPRPEFQEIAYPLFGLAATGPNDVWAVGARIQDDGNLLHWSTLIEHWDGSEWTAFYLPGEFMSGVVALAGDDVYAMGTDGALPLILHYDGAAWSMVPAPQPPGLGGRLAGALALGASQVWSVGQSFESDGDARTFVIRAPNTTGGNVSGGTGVSGAVVSWFGPENGSTEADLSGAYVAVDLVPGDYFFTAQYSSCTPATAQVTVAVGATVMKDLIVQCQ